MESIRCPKCNERNEAVRTYCWVCSQAFESDLSASSLAVSQGLAKPESAYVRQTVSLGSITLGIVKVILFLILGGAAIAGVFTLLLLVTCMGIARSN